MFSKKLFPFSRPRRQFFGWGVGLIASASLAGCNSSDTKTSSTANAGAQNKTLTVGLSSLGTAENWLPWLEAGREGWLVLEPVYESLVAVDPKTGEFLPELAESWDVSADGKRWRFKLRQNIPFHDGKGMFSAQDVLFSYDMYVSDKALASNKPILLNLVERIETISAHEIVFHLKMPDVTFLGRVCVGQFGIACKAYVESVGDREAMAKPIGTGPYRMVEHKRQESATFESVPKHWRRTPGFEKLVLLRVSDQAARLAMLRSGAIDITEIPYKLKREAEAAHFKFLRAPGAAIYHVQLGGQLLPSRDTFDPDVPWVGRPDDAQSQARALKVRRALSLAVDRKAIVAAVFEGEGVAGIAPYMAPGSRFVPADAVSDPYDPTRARQLLNEAGYADGFKREIEMLIMPWPGRAEMADVAEVVAGFWERNLGLKIKRRPMDFGTYAQQVGAPRKSAWVCWAHGYTPRPVAEPIIGMETWLMSKARYNSAAESVTIDEIAGRIRSTVDPVAREAVYQALATEFIDKAHAVSIASVPSLYAYNASKIGEWPLQPGEAYITGYEYATPA